MADRTVLVKIRATVTDFIAGMGKAGAATKGFGKEIDKSSKEHPEKLAKISHAALAMGGGLALGFGLAEKAVISFDKEMSAVSGATQASAKDLDALRQAALQAGADTAFSATDAATAEEALAKAGISTSDILSGALSGSLSLAAAGSLDLGTAAEDAASAMTTFGLHGQDVGHIADVLAAGAGKAQGDVSDLSMALSQSGLVAHQMGLSLDTTVGALSDFASRGLMGSDAGTSFKQMLLSLTPQSQQASDTMKDLGLNFFDANGKFVGLSKAAQQLKDKLGPLSQEQQQVALKTIFGSDAIRGATILMSDGAAGVDKWTNAVNDSGFAADLARRKMDNLAGDLEQLRGSLETALIKGGSGANGALRLLTQAATGAVNAFSDLPGPVQGTVTVLSGVSGGALLALGGIGTMIPKVREARDALKEMGSAGTKVNTLLGKLGKASVVGVGVLGLVAAVNELGKAIDKAALKGVPGVDNISASIKKLAVHGDMKAAGLDAHHLASAIQDVNSQGSGLSMTAHRLAGGLSALMHGNLKAASSTEAFRLAAKGDKEEVTNLDTAFAHMVDGGDVDAAKAAFSDLTLKLQAQGLSTAEIAKVFPQYTTALKNAKGDADLASAGLKGANTTIDATKDSAKDAADAVQDLKDKLDLLNGKNISVTQGALSFRDSMADLTQSFKDNGLSLDINSAKGRTNLSTFLDAASAAQDYAQAVVDQTGDQDAANKILGDTRTQLYNSMIQSGLTKKEAQHLIDTYLSVPAAVGTNLYANDKASGVIGGVQRKIDGIRGRTVTINVRTIYQNPGTSVRGVGNTKIGNAEGGLVRGPGSSTSDSIPRMLSNGEFVVQASSVDKFGLGFFQALNAGTLRPAIAAGTIRPASPTAAQAGPMSVSLSTQDRALLANGGMARVEVTGRLVGRGRDLVAVVTNESSRLMKR